MIECFASYWVTPCLFRFNRLTPMSDALSTGIFVGQQEEKIYIPLNLADSIPAIIPQTYYNHLLRLLAG